MHVLTVTTLYPNPEQIRNGVFVRERIRKLQELRSGVAFSVVAPVPWFPLKAARFGRYAAFARVPQREQDGDIPVLHPRFLQIPRVGELFAPLLYLASVRGVLRRAQLPTPHIVDAHFAFPDGVAAVMLGRMLNVPVSITVRGSDINLIAEEQIAGRWIRWALARADQVIAVSEALARKVKALLPADCTVPVDVVRNGVDLARFHPDGDVPALRRKLGLQGRVVLSVGNLIPLKGHDLVIQALSGIEDATLCIIGAGPERARLLRLAQQLGSTERVRLLGEMRQDELVEYYNAADVTVLASSHEGLPNVIIESLACGTPVVATPVGGIPEIMTDRCMGLMVDDRGADAIRDAILTLPAKNNETAARVRHSVSSWDWRVTASRLREIFSRMCEPRAAARLAVVKEE